MNLSQIVVKLVGIVLVLVGLAIVITLVHASWAALVTWLTLLGGLLVIGAGAYLIAGGTITL